MSTTQTTSTHYRIVSRPPGAVGWRFRHFTGAAGTDLARMKRSLARAYDECPGWMFKLEAQNVTVMTTPWSTVHDA